MPVDPKQLHRVAQELTRRLNSDQEFRALLASDPRAALTQIGLEVDDEQAKIIHQCLTASLLEAYAEGGGIVPFIYPS